MIAYADSSALVKLVLAEPESAALLTRLQSYDSVVSSTLELGEDVTLMAYDRRLIDAAEELELPTASPS